MDEILMIQDRDDLLTIREYEIANAALEALGVHVSLIDGRLVKKMSTSDQHSEIISTLIAFIKMHLITHRLPGIVTTQTTGFRFTESHCPEPDIAYVSQRTTTTGSACIDDDWPDFIIEVVSDPRRTDETQRLERDRSTWLERGAGVYEVWPDSRMTKVFAQGQSERIEHETLTFTALPGLEIPLAVVFANIGKK